MLRHECCASWRNWEFSAKHGLLNGRSRLYLSTSISLTWGVLYNCACFIICLHYFWHLRWMEQVLTRLSYLLHFFHTWLIRWAFYFHFLELSCWCANCTLVLLLDWLCQIRAPTYVLSGSNSTILEDIVVAWVIHVISLFFQIIWIIIL